MMWNNSIWVLKIVCTPRPKMRLILQFFYVVHFSAPFPFAQMTDQFSFWDIIIDWGVSWDFTRRVPRYSILGPHGENGSLLGSNNGSGSTLLGPYNVSGSLLDHGSGRHLGHHHRTGSHLGHHHGTGSQVVHHHRTGSLHWPHYRCFLESWDGFIFF